MKKLFKFFVATAIIAVGFMGCSEEAPVPVPNPEPDPIKTEVEEIPTYATFTFQLSGASTKAMQTDANEPATPITAFKSIRLLVFANGNDGLCIVDTVIRAFGGAGQPIEGQSATVLVTSGPKKVLVIANTGTKAIDGQIDGGTVKGMPYSTFLGASSPGVAPTAAPNRLDIGTTGSGTVTAVTFAQLVQVGTPESTTDAMVYSNGVATVKDLKPNITPAASEAGGINDFPDNNHFLIQVERVVAKGLVYYSGPTSGTAPNDSIVTLDTKGRLMGLTYNFRNINRWVNLFKDVTADSKPKPPTYTAFEGAGTPTDQNDITPFLPYYYRDDAITQPLVNSATVPASPVSLYITENNASLVYHGSKTYAGIQATYIPTPGTKFINAIGGYESAIDQFTGVTTVEAYTKGTTFYYLVTPFGSTADLSIINNQTGGIPSATLFLDETTVKKVIYATIHDNLTYFTDSIATGSGNRFSVDYGIAQLKEHVLKYTNGICYYRLDLREHANLSDSDKKFYVTRNNWYQAAITSFSAIGASEISDLDVNPGGTDELPTYVTAVITVADWKVINNDTPVVPWQ